MKYCPKCNKNCKNNEKFCPKCGTPVEEKIELKNCPSCNAENPESAKFCMNCGEAFGTTECKCSKCGKVFTDGSKFCNECGGKVEEVTSKSLKSQIEELKVELANVQNENEELNSKIKDLEEELNNLQDDEEISLSDFGFDDEDDDFVFVEGGTMDLGSSDRPRNPIHEVTLDSFYIAKYQVTQKLYQSVMGRNPSEFKGENRPVENVRWYDAVEFCNKLSEKEGLEPCYTIDKRKKDPNNENESDNVKWTVQCDWKKNGYRLPTEAEWEYAARGGQETGSYKYAGSDNLDSVGWYDDNSGDQTHDVGKKEPNELGLYDMSGNVWEWCWDWYDKNIKGKTNPRGAASGSSRVLHGGSWCFDFYYCAVSYRCSSNPYSCCNDGGFRLVRSSSNKNLISRSDIKHECFYEIDVPF